MTTYYVSSSTGNNGSAGTSEGAPWASLWKVNSTTLYPGDYVKLKRGDVFRETLKLYQSGTPSNRITITSYGSGDLPRVCGAALETGWTLYSGNVWKCTESNTVYDLHYDNTRGIRHDGTAYLLAEGDWFWNSSTSTLYLYCTSDPDAAYSQVEATIRYNCVDLNGQDYITVSYIHVDKAYERGVSLAFNTNYPIVDHCTISSCWHSGIWSSGNSSGQHEYGQITNNTVYDCAAHGIYHEGRYQSANHWTISDNVVTSCGCEVRAHVISGWSSVGGSIYSASVSSLTSGQQGISGLLCNGVRGAQKGSTSLLASDRDWYFNGGQLKLYVYAGGDPDTYWTSPGVEGITAARDWTAGIKIWGNMPAYTAPNSDTGCGYTTIEDNVITDTGPDANNMGHGVGIWIDECNRYNVIRNNVISGGSGAGICNEQTYATSIYYNLLYNNASSWWTGQIFIWRAPHDVTVYNNTCIGPGYCSICCEGTVYNASTKPGAMINCTVKNNIAIGSTFSMIMRASASNHDGGYGNVYTHNCLGAQYTDFVWYYNDDNISTYDTLESYYGAAMNNVESDPTFVDADGDDYRLAEGSACIDQGTSVGLSSDLLGNYVPFNLVVDVGCYEYSGVTENEEIVENAASTLPVTFGTGVVTLPDMPNEGTSTLPVTVGAGTCKKIVRRPITATATTAVVVGAGDVDDVNLIVKIVDPDNGPGTDYLNIAAWQAAFGGVPDGGDCVNNHVVARALCRSTAGTADTTVATITGWASASADYYPEIFVDPSYRWEFKYPNPNDGNYYRMEAGSTSYVLRISQNFCRVTGLAVKNTSASADYQAALRIQACSNVLIDSCVVTCNANGKNQVRGIVDYLCTSGNNYYRNCLVHNIDPDLNSKGFWIQDRSGGGVYFHHCTVADVNDGWYEFNSTNDPVRQAKNCTAYVYGADARSWYGTWTGDYNAANDAYAPGTNDITVASTDFANYGNNDYRSGVVGSALYLACPTLYADATLAVTKDYAGYSRADTGTVCCGFNEALGLTGAATTPAAVGSGTIVSTWSSSGASTLAAATGDARAFKSITAESAASTLAATTASAEASVARDAPGTATLAAATASGTPTRALSAEATSSLAVATATGEVDYQFAIRCAAETAPAVGAGTVTRATTLTATAETPTVTAAAEASVARDAPGIVILTAPTGDGLALAGWYTIAAATLSVPTGDALAGKSGNVIARSVRRRLPAITATASCTLARDATAASELAATTAAGQVVRHWPAVATSTLTTPAASGAGVRHWPATAAVSTPDSYLAAAEAIRHWPAAASSTTARSTASATVVVGWYSVGSPETPSAAAEATVDRAVTLSASAQTGATSGAGIAEVSHPSSGAATLAAAIGDSEAYWQFNVAGTVSTAATTADGVVDLTRHPKIFWVESRITIVITIESMIEVREE